MSPPRTPSGGPKGPSRSGTSGPRTSGPKGTGSKDAGGKSAPAYNSVAARGGASRRGPDRHAAGGTFAEKRGPQPRPRGNPDAPKATIQPRGPREDGREGERIAKLMARAGVASRREVERLIESGRVKLGDVTITTPATLLTTLRGITVDGVPVKAPSAAQLYAFHKPAGLLTAERDAAGRPTIYSALRNALPADAPRLMPVGRLDLNTEGLLLLTNDGELKRAMELPSSGIPRTYRARTFGDISQDRLEALMEGITVDGIHYGRIDANMERRTGRNQWIELTLTEGKNREVRRVLEALGLQVSRLMRLKYGPFELLDLGRGQVVQIPQIQVERFRKELTSPKRAEKVAEDSRTGNSEEETGE